ncbi:unnamed protein product [Prunus armeniaca]|uniref:Uncharacterized protein n=1 Tax=Prunus armeniaca TaxID=36596 RepID=A0A6J5XMS0_PRUAR|nr:unnamed protein product [Prunus armeniaca]
MGACDFGYHLNLTHLYSTCIQDDFLHAESSHLDGDQWPRYQMVFSDLQDLQTRIKAIEKAMVEKERHFSTNQVEKKLGDGVGNTMKKREISGSGKDIILDEISECISYGISRRDTIQADGQMLELWETTDQDASIDLMAGKGQKVAAVPTDHRSD